LLPLDDKRENTCLILELFESVTEPAEPIHKLLRCKIKIMKIVRGVGLEFFNGVKALLTY